MSLSRLLFLVAVAAAITLAFRSFVGEPIWIASPSMEPTLKVGAHIFLDKVTYRFRDPERGEIVVFESPTDPHDSVKRVVALPGDTMELRSKKLFINGVEVPEPYVQHVRAEERLKGDDLGPLHVPPAHYLVLGDNRDESADSSVWEQPFLPRSRIIGKVRGVY